MLAVQRVVDLTGRLGNDVAMWPGQPAPVYETKLEIDRDGVYLQQVHMWEHSGTHLDAPAHFFHDATSVDEIPAERLVCPVVVLDISDTCATDVDYALQVADVMAFEASFGVIPSGCAALVRTGWDAYVDNRERYMGGDERLHFPGVSEAAGRFLVETRHVVGIGIDTLGVDAGISAEFPVHRRVTLPNNVWNLEELVNLHLVPPIGAWLVVGVLPFHRGSGAPARVFALV